MSLAARLARLEAQQAPPDAPPGRWVLITIHGTPPPPAPVLSALPPGEVRYLMQDPDADPPAWNWAALERCAPQADVRSMSGSG
jgi:hypothetical protein